VGKYILKRMIFIFLSEKLSKSMKIIKKHQKIIKVLKTIKKLTKNHPNTSKYDPKKLTSVI